MDRSFAGDVQPAAPAEDEAAGEPVGEALRQVMRRVPAAVSVVTATAGGLPFGMTATSFTTVSLEPPAVAVAVNRSASLHDCLRQQGTFAINVLPEGAEPVARAFATKELTQAQRFALVPWRRGRLELPLLEGALATLVCEIVARMTHGTHVLLIGRVVAATSRGDDTALLYAGGGYRKLAP